MGYDTGHIHIYFRTSAHNSVQDEIDCAAVENLVSEINALIAADDDYKRVIKDVWTGA